ncbi:MAG: DNA primase noncatalytic subunit PriX [Candidatus Marsarchaeota archaeon]|nr:DNA primase noncatalytic subunit PriX [Candidatus Marsarchaeota archaeon]
MYSQEELDFAYKYPFSKEAKSVVSVINPKHIDPKYISMGRSRLEEALEKDRLEYKEANYGKEDAVIAYAYARMLVSALKRPDFISKYAKAEARRVVDVLENDSDPNLLQVCNQLGLNMKAANDGFELHFVEFLVNAPNTESFALVNQGLTSGSVHLDRHRAIRIISKAVEKAIAAGLPISYDSIPKSIKDASKGIKLPIIITAMPRGNGRIGWIDRLLETAIPDCRHRTVNIILAPYLTNIKGLDVDKATQLISNYIQLCKTVNPDTNITDRYIRYQCEYAKSHGLKPLSLKRARTELGAIDFRLILGEAEEEEAEKEPGEN